MRFDATAFDPRMGPSFVVGLALVGPMIGLGVGVFLWGFEDNFWWNIFYVSLGVVALVVGSLSLSVTIECLRQGLPLSDFEATRQNPPRALMLVVLSAVVLIAAMKVGTWLAAGLEPSSFPPPLPDAQTLRGIRVFVAAEFAAVTVVSTWLVCLYVMTPSSGKSGAVLSGTIEAANAFATTVSKVVSFVRGLVWIAGAVVLWQIGSWWSSGSPTGMVGVVIYGGMLIAAAKGFAEMLPALRSAPQLRNQGVHGDERLATPAEGKRAARGEPVGSPTIDPQKLNY
jgi:hypothetical protein